MSTNTKSSTDTAFFDPSSALVTLEQTTRQLRTLLADMKNKDYRQIATLAEQAENAAYAIDKWASSLDLEADEAAFEANETRWNLLVNRMNKHFGSGK